MMRILVILGVVGGLSVLAGRMPTNAQIASISWPWDTIRSQATTSYPIAANGVLQISDPSGDIAIIGGGGSSVEVTVKKSATNRVDLDALGSHADTMSGSGQSHAGIAITADYPSHCTNCDVSYDIRVPRGVQIKIDADSGDVHVKGTDGLIDVSSSSGDVRLVDDSGSVNVDEASGDVKLTDVSGPTRVKSSSGSIDATGLTKDVDFDASSGDVVAKFASLNGVATVRMRTESGSITLDVPTGFGARIRASTESGQLSSNMKLPIHDRESGSDLSVAVGNGRTAVDLVAASGDISITAR